METKSILVSRFNRARINLGDCVLRNLSSLASTLREISDEGGQVHSRVEIGAGDVLDLLFREMRRRPEWGISEWGGWWQDPALLLITLRGPVDCGDQLIGVDLNKWSKRGYRERGKMPDIWVIKNVFKWEFLIGTIKLKARVIWKTVNPDLAESKWTNYYLKDKIVKKVEEEMSVFPIRLSVMTVSKASIPLPPITWCHSRWQGVGWHNIALDDITTFVCSSLQIFRGKPATGRKRGGGRGRGGGERRNRENRANRGWG